MQKSITYVDFPKAGLGNMLLTWSRAFVFAKLNGLELDTSGWAAIHYGAWLRFERKKRFYTRYFKKRNFLIKLQFKYRYLVWKKIYEPEVAKQLLVPAKTVFVFNKIFNDYDFFKEIRVHKTVIKEGLLSLLNRKMFILYKNAQKPIIGVHIRRGDFKKASTLTPVSFFIDVIRELRNKLASELPVTVFTDASREEINDLISLPSVTLSKVKADVLDLLLLSESQFLILSIGSTFSYWAGFLSENIVIKHKQEWHVPFLTDSNSHKEITIDQIKNLDIKPLLKVQADVYS